MVTIETIVIIRVIIVISPSPLIQKRAPKIIVFCVVFQADVAALLSAKTSLTISLNELGRMFLGWTMARYKRRRDVGTVLAQVNAGPGVGSAKSYKANLKPMVCKSKKCQDEIMAKSIGLINCPANSDAVFSRSGTRYIYIYIYTYTCLTLTLIFTHVIYIYIYVDTIISLYIM